MSPGVPPPNTLSQWALLGFLLIEQRELGVLGWWGPSFANFPRSPSSAEAWLYGDPVSSIRMGQQSWRSLH